MIKHDDTSGCSCCAEGTGQALSTLCVRSAIDERQPKDVIILYHGLGRQTVCDQEWDSKLSCMLCLSSRCNFSSQKA